MIKALLHFILAFEPWKIEDLSPSVVSKLNSLILVPLSNFLKISLK